MRYSLFEYLYKMCTTFQEAAEQIAKSPGNDSQLVSECIEGFRAVHTVLKNNEDSVLDPILWKYCDECERQCQELQNESGALAQKTKTQFFKAAAAFRQSFRKEISVQYKVVFFADLGQKWDSLNSVYRAFRARSDCETAVVQAPIFRQVKIHGVKEKDIIYDDYLKEARIPNIPYRYYDISKELPDLAFTSNPYESTTTEQFWPESIAKYTHLVYIPYYTDVIVTPHILQPHCSAPVAECAWRFIEASPEFLSLHRKYAPRHGDNVLIIGLPKWDAIEELKKNPVAVPESWKNKLNGRKVFLWNSHYALNECSTLLQLGKKIADLFLHNKNIALIWRPHPMTKTMFKLYFREFKSFWDTLCDVVQTSENMILDENPFYGLSFQCSDALLSDDSSIIPQYLLLDQPILYLRNKEHHKRLMAHAIARPVDITKLEYADNIDDIKAFVERVCSGIDLKRKERKALVETGMPHADGHVGERVCTTLLNELQNELD